MKLSPIEREVVVLRLVVEVINSMVNREMLNFAGEREVIQATFRSQTRRALFSVLLADLLEPVAKELLDTDDSLLKVLASVASDSRFGFQSNQALFSSVDRLNSWLEHSVTVYVWFPSLNVEVDLSLRRRDFVSICGNISKHNPARLTGNAKRLMKLLEDSDVAADFTGCLRALDDFYERFHTDILSYHSTVLAEMLNEIRWAIHEHLKPEFARAYIPPTSDENPLYSFDLPDGIENGFAQDCYWDLMNAVRSGPWIERFVGTHNLKQNY